MTPHRQYQLNLLDLTRYAKSNDGYRYCLVGVCVMTRFGYAVACRTKSALEILAHFKKIYQERLTIKILQTDEGMGGWGGGGVCANNAEDAPVCFIFHACTHGHTVSHPTSHTCIRPTPHPMPLTLRTVTLFSHVTDHRTPHTPLTFFRAHTHTHSVTTPRRSRVHQ